jgi:hypothetical protein
MAKVDRGSLATAGTVDPIEFYHANFRRGHPELLHLMQRRVSGAGGGVLVLVGECWCQWRCAGAGGEC